MSAYLCLEPFMNAAANNDYRILNAVISRYERMAEISAFLTDAGWDVKVFNDDDSYFCIIHPPTPVETEFELENQLKLLNVNYETIGHVALDEDFEGEISINDFDECSCGICDECMEDDDEDEEFPVIPNYILDSLVGHTIVDAELIDNYRVVFYFDDGRKLVYDEDDAGFTMIEAE